MKVCIVEDTSERTLAQAIDSGLCAGAISTNVHLRYFLATDQLLLHDDDYRGSPQLWVLVSAAGRETLNPKGDTSPVLGPL